MIDLAMSATWACSAWRILAVIRSTLLSEALACLAYAVLSSVCRAARPACVSHAPRRLSTRGRRSPSQGAG